MSIDKIGSSDRASVMNHNQAQAQHKLQKTQIKDSIDATWEVPAKSNATKISYPPFFPVGDTQGIYKK